MDETEFGVWLCITSDSFKLIKIVNKKIMKAQTKIRKLCEFWNANDLRSILFHGKCKLCHSIDWIMNGFCNFMEI